MSSAIGSTTFGSLTPDQLSNALHAEFLGQIPNGATTTFNYGSGTTTNGRGNNQHGSTSPAVIISFSPAAIAAINRDQVALQVINGDQNQKLIHSPVSTPSTPAQPVTDNSAIAAPTDNGTPLLNQYRQMSVTDRFYAIADASEVDGCLTPDQKASFDAAFNSRTLNIQDAADVPLLDDKETWTVSKTAGGGESGSGSFSAAYQPPPGQHAVVFGTIFGGDMLVSWDSQPSSGNGAHAAVPPNATG